MLLLGQDPRTQTLRWRCVCRTVCGVILRVREATLAEVRVMMRRGLAEPTGGAGVITALESCPK